MLSEPSAEASGLIARAPRCTARSPETWQASSPRAAGTGADPGYSHLENRATQSIRADRLQKICSQPEKWLRYPFYFPNSCENNAVTENLLRLRGDEQKNCEDRGALNGGQQVALAWRGDEPCLPGTTYLHSFGHAHAILDARSSVAMLPRLYAGGLHRPGRLHLVGVLHGRDDGRGWRPRAGSRRPRTHTRSSSPRCAISSACSRTS